MSSVIVGGLDIGFILMLTDPNSQKMMQNRNKIYVHCGLHKTGTTALQAALRAHEPALRQGGFLYPYSGTLGTRGLACKPSEAGHHNIAWQLTRDRRYSNRHGDIGALRAEIAAFDGSVILSSEDFETILTAPEQFRPLCRLAEETGRELVLVVYLRNQISYLESAYGQLLFHGFGQEYSRCAEAILASGVMQRSEWQFQFDYRRIVDIWDEFPDASLIIRDYHAFSGPALTNDFTQCIGLGPLIGADQGQRPVNEREPVLRAVARFYRNRIGRNLNPMEAARVRRLCGELPARLDSGAALRAAFASRFNEDNAAICRRAGLEGSGLMISTKPQIEHPVTLAELFSFETQCAIRFGSTTQDEAVQDVVHLPLPDMTLVKPTPVKRRRRIKYLLNAFMEKAYFTDLEFFDI